MGVVAHFYMDPEARLRLRLLMQGSDGFGSLSGILLQMLNRPSAAQVQGVLTRAATIWPHIHISDSLVMADSAVKMAEAGCESIAVLGVDFMSENVRAILDEAGHTAVRVSIGSEHCCAQLISP